MNSLSQNLQLPLPLNRNSGDDLLQVFVLRKIMYDADNAGAIQPGPPLSPGKENNLDKPDQLILVRGIHPGLFNDIIQFIAETHQLEITLQQMEPAGANMVSLNDPIKGTEKLNIGQQGTAAPSEMENRLSESITKRKSLDESNRFLHPGNDMLQAVNKEIEKRLEDEHFKACHLAKAFNICEMQLHRKLKKLAKLSPANYIRKYRLHRSCAFLKQPSANITEVCFMAGFRSLEYFSRSFKKEFGVSPTVFRQSC